MKKKEIFLEIFIWILLMLITFVISYGLNTKLVDGIMIETGESVGGIVTNWFNVILSMAIITILFIAILFVWKKFYKKRK